MESVGLESSSRAQVQQTTREEDMVVLQEEMVNMLDLLTLSGRACERSKWSRFPLIVSYCYDIPKSNDACCLKHRLSVRRPSMWCLTRTAVI